EVVRRYGVSRIHKLCEFNGFVPVHNSLPLYAALPSEVVWWAAARQPTRFIEFFADTIRNASTWQAYARAIMNSSARESGAASGDFRSGHPRGA
ncbi:MAG: hypothetical protein ACXWPK_17405, partial [Isosphaeraceae bacterium]